MSNSTQPSYPGLYGLLYADEEPSGPSSSEHPQRKTGKRIFRDSIPSFDFSLPTIPGLTQSVGHSHRQAHRNPTTPGCPTYRCFSCEQCGSTFPRKDDLQVHILTDHQESTLQGIPSYGSFVYHKVLAPLDFSALSQDRLGTFRGIQGENNSCYLDASLMAMFYCTNAFDAILSAPESPYESPVPVDNNVEYARLYLTMHIVNNLRSRGFVPSMLVVEWRRMIAPWLNAGINFDHFCSQEEACEFVHFVLETFAAGRADYRFCLTSVQDGKKPARSSSHGSLRAGGPGRVCSSNGLPAGMNGQSMLQLLPPGKMGQERSLWTLEMLLHSTLESERLCFAHAASSLILQLPRYGKGDRLVGAVLPNTFIEVNTFKGEKTTYVLQSLIVIGTGHFVTYLRLPTGRPPVRHVAGKVGRPNGAGGKSRSHRWLYFDSMSDRVHDQNVPLLKDVTNELGVLERKDSAERIAQEIPKWSTPQNHLQRVVQDMAMAFYVRIDDSSDKSE